jgi:uncharacterized damage-inducible protein DinB
MTYYGAKDLASAFRTVRTNTIKIAEEVGEEHYGFRAAPDTRSISETLVHIANIPKIAYEVHAVKKLDTLVGFDFMGFIGPLMAAEKNITSKAEILKMLTDGRDLMGNWMEGLSEDFLAQQVGMHPSPTNPPTKSRFEMLLGMKEHEMHHRAQLMTLERMIGIVPHLTRQMQAMMAQMQQAQTQQAGKS